MRKGSHLPIIFSSLDIYPSISPDGACIIPVISPESKYLRRVIGIFIPSGLVTMILGVCLLGMTQREIPLVHFHSIGYQKIFSGFRAPPVTRRPTAQKLTVSR